MHSLGKTLLAFALLHFVHQGQTCLILQVSLDFPLFTPVPYDGQEKSLKCSTWMQSQKRQRALCFQGKPFNITVIQVYAPSNAEEVGVECFYEVLQDLLELTPKKDVRFIIRDWNAKVRSQEIPGVTGKFGL